MLLSLLALAPMAANTVSAQTAREPEKQKIETLIQRVGALKDVKFVRNGTAYDGATAVRFLHGKWKANEAGVVTARDFIDKIASASGTSGKPYLIRFTDGREIASRDFLLAELRTIDTPR